MQILEPTKVCNDCGIEKPHSEFYKANTKLGIRKECKKCSNVRASVWNKANKEKRRAAMETFHAANPNKARDYYLRANYGLTHEEYEDLLIGQCGVCALCGKPPIGKRLAVDHDHNTGEIRGLLCLNCNKYKLGQLTLEDVSAIKKYLENPPIRQMFGGVSRYVPEGKEKPKRRRKKRAVSRRRVR